MPVPSWSDSGADVEFAAASAQPPIIDDSDYFLQVADALKGVGRFSRNSRIWTMSGILPKFDGYDDFGGFDGETSALRLSCEWLKGDLIRLFNDMPGRGVA